MAEPATSVDPGIVPWMPRWWPFGRKDSRGESEDGGSQTLGPGRLIRQYCVFVSSADDVIDQRNVVEGLVRNSVNPELAAQRYLIRLEAEMWEKAHPRRLFGRETIDDEFVKKAKDSDLVLAMLYERLGGGTKKEIEAVLTSTTPLSLLWFVSRKDNPKTPAAKYIRKLEKRKVLRHKRAGRPGEPENAEAIFQVLLNVALEAVARPIEDPRARL